MLLKDCFLTNISAAIVFILHNTTLYIVHAILVFIVLKRGKPTLTSSQVITGNRMKYISKLVSLGAYQNVVSQLSMKIVFQKLLDFVSFFLYRFYKRELNKSEIVLNFGKRLEL